MNDQKPTYYIASFSGGKDSTAMVLRLIELGERLDEVICCDTTMEFPAMYKHIEKIKRTVEVAGIKFTMLKPEHDFEFYLIEHEVNKRKMPKNPPEKFIGVQGYGWPGHMSRWCTKRLKTGLIDAYLRELYQRYNVIQYIGIAADETYRLKRKNNQATNMRFPLVEWGWSEERAMQYCRRYGYEWEGLYDIFDRVSCWCCPLQSLAELRKLRKFFPELWEKLLFLDAQQNKPYNHGFSVADLALRFELEDALLAIDECITDRAFHADRKRVLAREATINDIICERLAAKGVVS
jgi:3'-phosphoadenosine 5'-phosphosulfate sulfotransferase (PAPS reductase)/FAD synthetase